VATCPATATDVSNSSAIATNNGANIRDELDVEKNARATAAMKRFWFRACFMARLVGRAGRPTGADPLIGVACPTR